MELELTIHVDKSVVKKSAKNLSYVDFELTVFDLSSPNLYEFDSNFPWDWDCTCLLG